MHRETIYSVPYVFHLSFVFIEIAHYETRLVFNVITKNNKNEKTRRDYTRSNENKQNNFQKQIFPSYSNMMIAMENINVI